jgi:FkbM family methyltransferase
MSSKILKDYLNLELPYLGHLENYVALSTIATILEVGSCEAEDTIKFVRDFPQAKIHCFEPLEKNLDKAKSNLKEYATIDNITLNNVAVSRKTGRATFYVSSGQPVDTPRDPEWDYGNKSSSLFKPGNNEHHSWLTFNKKIIVETIRLDNYLLEKNISGVDLIHMDVQGAELDVLIGLGTKLSSVKAIWLEVESQELYEKQPVEKDIEEFMKNNSFTCVFSTVGKVLGDKLYIRDDLLTKIGKSPYKPRVSVLMSVYNSEKFLKRAIDSILAQTYNDFEFVIIDDGSSDSSISIIESYKDKRIRLVTRENWGLTASLNQGIEICRGEFLARMDSDDISTLDRLETEVMFLDKNPKIALVGSNYTIIEEKTGKVKVTTNVFTQPKDLKVAQVVSNQYGHGSIMVRKPILQECGGYDPSVGHVEDYDLWTKISRTHDIANIQRPLYLYRSVASGVTLSKHEEQIKLAFEVRNRAFEHFLLHRGEYHLFSWSPRSSKDYAQKKAMLYRDYAFMYRKTGHRLKALALLGLALTLDPRHPNNISYIKQTINNRPLELWQFEFL